MESFDGALLFVDFSMVSDPALVGTIVASLLGLSVQSERRDARHRCLSTGQADSADPRYLRTSDRACGRFRIVDLRGRTERSHSCNEPRSVADRGRERLSPGHAGLSARGTELSAEVARTFPAIQLFVERARASGAQLKFQRRRSSCCRQTCAASLTAWRLRSSSRRDGWRATGCMGPRRYWTRGWRFRGPDREALRRGREPCTPRSTGVTAFSPIWSGSCCAGLLYSSGNSRSMR